jgi:hypothetical protein
MKPTSLTSDRKTRDQVYLYESDTVGIEIEDDTDNLKTPLL